MKAAAAAAFRRLATWLDPEAQDEPKRTGLEKLLATPQPAVPDLQSGVHQAVHGPDYGCQQWNYTNWASPGSTHGGLYL